MRNILLAAAAISAIAAPAFAQSGPDARGYGSLGYTHLEGDSATTGAVTGRLGAKFTPHFGVEGEASFGVRDDDFAIGAVDGKIEHRYDVAAYGVATLPIQPNFDLFARVGYGVTELKASAGDISESTHLDSWNYGAGGNYYFDAQNGVRADWTRRDFKDDGGEADVYSVNYVRRF